MAVVLLVLLIAAAVCFALAAANVPTRPNMIGLGLLLCAVWALVPAIGAAAT